MADDIQCISQQIAFGPKAIETLSLTLSETCRALDISEDDVEARRIIAARLIDLAQSGKIDPVALRDRIVRESSANI